MIRTAQVAHAGAGVPCRSPSLRAAALRPQTNQEDQTLTLEGLFSCPVYIMGWVTWAAYDAYGKQKITDASGNVTRAKSAVGWDRGFTGYITDNETGLLHARARQYSPTLGRFVGRDSVTFYSMNSVWMPGPYQGYLDGLSLYGAYFVPMGLDPAGLWDTETHHFIIDQVFAADLEKYREQMKKASDDQDSITGGGQSAENSYKHGMRSPGQSANEARKMSYRYELEQLQKAAAKYCAGDKSGSAYEFGLGVHTITDSWSPEHRDPNGDPMPWGGAAGLVKDAVTDALVRQFEMESGTVRDDVKTNAEKELSKHQAGEDLSAYKSNADRAKGMANALRRYEADFTKIICEKCPCMAPPGACKPATGK